MTLNPNTNINRLLEKLPQGTLAHMLVSALREFRRDEWPKVLKDVLKARMSKKVKELTDAQDQASGD